MPSRYRIVPFGPAEVANPNGLLMALASSSHPTRAYRQWDEIVAHLAALGVGSLLVQTGVRDPDFLQEYEAFYSKQHRPLTRYCVRVHAFRCAPPADSPANEAESVLAFIDAAAANEDVYAGFVTLRPLRHAPIGATILAHIATKPTLCRDKFPVHIAGTTFKVVGTPYLQQDNAVGACAQASIWMALRTIRKRSGNSAYSPADLTLSATRYQSLNRVFPGRNGLTIQQMVAAITDTDHDPLVIHAANPPQKANPASVINDCLPYLDSGLPVILALMHPQHGGHAVVAIGVDPASTNLAPDSLLIHNDNQGPYRLLPKMVPNGSSEYALNQAFALIVPLPEGVLMSAAEAILQGLNHLRFWLNTFLSTPVAPNGQLPLAAIVPRTYLCSRHHFREWAKNCSALDPAARDIYRTAELPKLLWVIELHDAASFTPASSTAASRLGEVVLDASADAEHGDGLILLRLASQMVTAPTLSAAMLVVQGAGTTAVALNQSTPCHGLTAQWDEPA